MTQIIQPALLFPMYAGLIPTMTNTNVPSGLASSIGGIDISGHRAWNAMSRVPTDYWDPGTSAINIGITYQFPLAVKINRYAIKFAATANIDETWNFQGSNDGSTYTTIHSGTYTASTQVGLLLTFIVVPTIAYTYYQWVYLTVGSNHRTATVQVYS